MNIHTIALAQAGSIDFVEVERAFLRHRLVLLRGRTSDLDTFEALTRHLCGAFHVVGTRHALRQAAGDGFTTEVFRSNFILFGHAEGVYRPYPPPPEICFFMCVVPPAAPGGETTLIDGEQMLEAIPRDLRERLEAVGIIYESSWEPIRWQKEFGVDTEPALCALLEQLPNIRFSLTDGNLRISYSTPAIACLPDGSPVFVNGILAHLPRIDHPRYRGLPVYSKATNRVYFGDGELIPDQVINALIDAHDQVRYRHRWLAGDILIIDNTRYMHGREMTTTPCTRVLVSRFGGRSSLSPESPMAAPSRIGDPERKALMRR
jgi:alpha-ketoglutarate-dependent taurine dioxygenase